MSTGITSGKRVADLRKRLSLSQQRLADLLDVSRSYLGDIETGRSEPSVAFLTALTSVTDGSADWILTGEGPMLRSERNPSCDPGHKHQDRRVAALMELLDQISQEERSLILADAHSRAATAQQIDELRQAVATLTACARTGTD